jgi:hypothetical protein
MLASGFARCQHDASLAKPEGWRSQNEPLLRFALAKPERFSGKARGLAEFIHCFHMLINLIYFFILKKRN